MGTDIITIVGIILFVGALIYNAVYWLRDDWQDKL